MLIVATLRATIGLLKMRYTLLDFAPYSSKRRTLVSQAEFLLQEIVAGRVHKFPCACGACICWAYRQAKRRETRSYSTRTLFIAFLRVDFYLKAVAESMPVDYSRLKDAAADERWKAVERRDAKRGVFGRNQRSSDLKERRPGVLLADVYYAEIRSRARSGVLAVLKELAKGPRTRAERAFLHGILNKKSFYRYYSRAGNKDLARIFESTRRQLFPPSGENPLRRRASI